MKINKEDKILIYDKNYKKVVGQVSFNIEKLDIKLFMKIFRDESKYNYFLNEINRKYLLK